MNNRITAPGLAALSSAVVKREIGLFDADVANRQVEIREKIAGARILIIGGAGSIGSYTIRAILPFAPASVDVVDINENGLTDLIRDLRASNTLPAGVDFRTVPMDFGSPLMKRMLREEAPYDLVLNFAAVKHVRSEKNVYSLLHMLDTNVIKAARLLHWLGEAGFEGRYFSVSTDKAANPVNAMGGSKRIMEMVTFSSALLPARVSSTSARFANVAFSNGSLLSSFITRLAAGQPLAAPRDTRRFFITLPESGNICLLAATLAEHATIVVPRLSDPDLTDVAEVGEIVIRAYGLEPRHYEDEQLAIRSVSTDLEKGMYPLLLTALDTSGEKAYEEFVGSGETLAHSSFAGLQTVRPELADDEQLRMFLSNVEDAIREPERAFAKQTVLGWMHDLLPLFRHVETGKSLDSRL